MTEHKPIRCFEGDAKPHEPFWRMVNAAESESGEAEIELYGVISEYSWFEDDITPKKFKEDLYVLGGGGPITVRIDSSGGDVFAASVIRAVLTDYPGRVTTRIDGIAASAAVVVALAGQTVRIMDTGYMMIHDPAVIVFLSTFDIETLKGLARDLKAIKRGIVDTYADYTGLSQEKISSMMSAETWMSAQEAVEYGFATEIIKGGQKTDPQDIVNRAYVNALHTYVNVPDRLLTSQPENPEDSEPISPKNKGEELDPAAQRLLDEVKLYTSSKGD